ncbi:MAG: PEGA domain-containing protein [Candidatus Lokiarchaeota archaeon]|nr:PEGA domain-containing protein [Candidatus Lokiarchaeota archaeon]
MKHHIFVVVLFMLLTSSLTAQRFNFEITEISRDTARNIHLPTKPDAAVIALYSDILPNNDYLRLTSPVIEKLFYAEDKISDSLKLFYIRKGRHSLNIEVDDINVVKYHIKRLKRMKFASNDSITIEINHIYRNMRYEEEFRTPKLFLDNELKKDRAIEIESEIGEIRLFVNSIEDTNFDKVRENVYKIYINNEIPKDFDITFKVLGYNELKKQISLDKNYIIYSKLVNDFKMSEEGDTLIVDSAPRKANIYINGKFMGRTPATIAEYGGNIQLLLTKKSYYDSTISIILNKEEKTNVFIDLKKKKFLDRNPFFRYSFLGLYVAGGAWMIYDKFIKEEKKEVIISEPDDLADPPVWP